MFKPLPKILRGLYRLIFALLPGWCIPLSAQPAGMPAVALIPDIEDNSRMLADARMRWEIAGIESALENGFLSVADTLSSNLLQRTELTQPTRIRLLNNRLRISLLQGDLGEAGLVIGKIRDAGAEADPLLEAYYYFFTGDRSMLLTTMGQLASQPLDQDQSAWLKLLEGMLLATDNRLEDANEAFNEAESIAPNGIVRDQFELIRLRENLSNGQADEVTISALRESVRSLQGERSGYEAARLLAVALSRLGQTDEAVSVLSAQLERPGLREFNLRSDFLLLIGNIAGPGSSRGQLVLREVIEDPDSPVEHRSLALTQLAQTIKTTADRDAFVGDLERWLADPTVHPLSDRFLAYCAYFRADKGDFEEAERNARQLLERFPTSVFAANALRMLAYTSWNQNPPRYRTAAGYLNRLRQQYPESDDAIEAGILIGDCYFLNGDFANAADMYGAMLSQVPETLASGVFFQNILAKIRAGSIAEAGDMIDSIRGDRRITDDMIWKAEWNLLDTMRRSGQSVQAYQRIQRILGEYATDTSRISRSIVVRFRWLEARLTLEAGPREEAIAMARNLLAELSADETRFDKAFLDGVRSHLLLLQGEAEIASGNRETGIATFVTLRQAFPTSGATILSYLVESRSESASDNLVSAQQSLIALVDRFPESEYAPIALWEAALNAEQRGLNPHLQEAIAILEGLVSNYPDDELVYFARLKQGDLARRLNDFPTALLLYDRLLAQYQGHPERYRAEISRADCLMALGSDDPARYDQAAVVYERNCLLPVAPLAVRVESGFKWAHSLRQQGDIDGCEAVLWLLFDRFIEDEDLSETIVHAEAGRYWLSRILLELGSIQLEQGETATAAKVYDRILEMGLPGASLARARKDALRQQG